MSDIKSRFDGKMPFDVLRAEDFGGDLFEFYEPLEELMRKASGVDIEGSRTTFLIGGRGTGKTMVLRFLSLEMQLKNLIKNELNQNKSIEELNAEEMQSFLDAKKYIGIFLHFKTTEYDSLKGEIAPLFAPYLSIRIAEEILKALSVFKSSGLVSTESEARISMYFAAQIKVPKPKVTDTFETALALIRQDIIPRFETIFEKSSFDSIADIKANIDIPVIIYKNIIFGLSDLAVTEVKALEGKNMFILLDELEYLSDFHIRRIGALLKDSDETSVIFKIGSRYMPKVLFVGDSKEILQEPHDFRKINITDALNATHSLQKTDYSKLIKNILNKRLARSDYFSDRGITDIGQLFPDVNNEALEIVRGRKKHWAKFITFLKKSRSRDDIEHIISCLKYEQNPIIEKLNMLLYYRGNAPEEIRTMSDKFINRLNSKYNDLYSKNALNLLFQLCSDYRVEKKYIGIDVYIHLSSGIIRNAIELCNQALKTAYNYGYKPAVDNPIDSIYQHMGAKHHAEIQYEDITRIPGNLGMAIQYFINELGTVFRELHLNRDLVEPEPNHFETVYSEISAEVKEVFDTSLDYSYIQRKPAMDPKLPHEAKKDDFLINRILAPYFKISYRVRGRTYISASQINRLILGDSDKRRRVRREIIKNNTKKKISDVHSQASLL